MVMISLLDLPLDLPEPEVRQDGMKTFLDGLPEYLSRCKADNPDSTGQADKDQVRRLRAAFPGAPGQRHMAHTHSVP